MPFMFPSKVEGGTPTVALGGVQLSASNCWMQSCFPLSCAMHTSLSPTISERFLLCMTDITMQPMAVTIIVIRTDFSGVAPMTSR